MEMELLEERVVAMEAVVASSNSGGVPFPVSNKTSKCQPHLAFDAIISKRSRVIIKSFCKHTLTVTKTVSPPLGYNLWSVLTLIFQRRETASPSQVID